MKLNMNSTREGETLAIVLEGELTLTESPSFKSWVTRELDSAESPREVAVDCDQIEYIDSTGLGALIFLRKAVLDRGGKLRLTRVSGWLRKFLQVTGLERTFMNPVSAAAPPPRPESQS